MQGGTWSTGPEQFWPDALPKSINNFTETSAGTSSTGSLSDEANMKPGL